MSILHYILTGKAFAETKNRWHENTWLKRIGPDDDYVFLEGESDTERKAFGAGTAEGPGLSSIIKIKEFYKHIVNKWQFFSYYDWFVFSDSDCYIYAETLKNFLFDFRNHVSPLFIGRLNLLTEHPGFFKGDTHNCQMSKFLRKEVPWGPFICHNGGCGWVLNKSAMLQLCSYVNYYGDETIISEHYDLAHSLWLHDCDIPMVHTRLFRTEAYQNLKDFGDYRDDNVITLHYMKEEDFNYVDSQL